MLSTITPYFGLFSARAEFAVHGASIAASHKNVCWEVAARHYSAQLAPSCNQTYKYVIWSISQDKTSHLFYLLRCNVGVFKGWKVSKEPWKISRSIGSSGWIVCKFADDVWCLQAKPGLCLLPLVKLKLFLLAIALFVFFKLSKKGKWWNKFESCATAFGCRAKHLQVLYLFLLTLLLQGFSGFITLNHDHRLVVLLSTKPTSRQYDWGGGKRGQKRREGATSVASCRIRTTFMGWQGCSRASSGCAQGDHHGHQHQIFM